MRNYNVLEKGIQLLILTTPICLNSKKFMIKEPLIKVLEIMKTLKNFRFMSQEIDPRELAKIINETDIQKVFLPTEIGAGPHTLEKTSSSGLVDTLDEREHGIDGSCPIDKNHKWIHFLTQKQKTNYFCRGSAEQQKKKDGQAFVSQL